MAGSKIKNQPIRQAQGKQSKIKKKDSKLELPQIFRKITARAPFLTSIHLWRWLIVIIILSILALQIVQMGQTLYSNYYESQIILAQKQAIEAEIAKWEKIVMERPNYRDAYFELALLTYQLNRPDETKMYLNKVFELDPNYQPARELEKILGY